MRSRGRSGRIVGDSVDRVVRVGKGAVFLVGLAVTFALVFVGVIAATSAVLGDGEGAFLSGDPTGGIRPRG